VISTATAAEAGVTHGRFIYRPFAVGDWNAFFALLLDNMVNLVVLASILVGAFGFPADVIYTRMIPGTALGVLVGDLVYTWLAIRLARKLQRQDVTAMPLGLDTPSTIGMALAVLGPAFLAMKGDLVAGGVAEADAVRSAAEGTWAIGMAVLLMIGVVKLMFSFVGETVRKHVPTAGLLGSIGGIGLALLAFLPLLDIFRAPVVGMVALGIVLYALVARIEMPWRLPGAALAVLVGTILYYTLGPAGLLGAEAFRAPSLELHVALPLPTLDGFRALGAALPYLPIAIPFGLLTIVGGINVTESAHAAGDTYKTRDILLTEAVATLVAGACGGVAQSTPYIGHPAYKEMGARAGYTLMTGIAVGLGGMLGYVSFVTDALPLAAVVPLLVFIGLEITTQAFHASPKRHAPAVAFSFLPIIAYVLLIRQDILFGGLYGAIAAATPQLGEQTATVRSLVNSVAAQTHAEILAGLAHGFILTAMIWGSFFALIIDRALVKAALFIAIAGVLTLFGVIHSAAPTGALYWPWRAPSPMAIHWAVGYFALAAVIAVLSFRSARGPVAGTEGEAS
jgi:AGZA family xanthine/uracil permease-like MFS transporter